MSQERFEQQHQAQWRALEQWLETQTQRRARHALPAEDIPHLYRQICHHLALARERQYSSHLVERLNRVVLAGHQQLYQARAGTAARTLRFFAVGFPSLVRREARLFWLCFGLLYGPLLAVLLTIQIWPEMAYTVLTPHEAQEYEQMYSPERARVGRERASDSDFLMFGVYIRNNIGIAFQTFAGGLLLGVGTLFYLLFNGIEIGAVAGHLTQQGLTTTFYSFVVGHSAFELTAIVLAGVAGLKLGAALLRPGRRSRMQALREAAGVSVQLVYGVVALLIVAAFIEAFWSSNTFFEPRFKYLIGLALWLWVLAYFAFMGRRHAP